MHVFHWERSPHPSDHEPDSKNISQCLTNLIRKNIDFEIYLAPLPSISICITL